MFTGIVEEVGILEDLHRGNMFSRLKIKAGKVLEGTKMGDSIAVNGICLTVTRLEKDCFEADVMAETFKRTNLGSLVKGSPLNLERALSLSSRLGGHVVSGHIDGTGVIIAMEAEGNAVWMTIKTDCKILNYIIEKGAVAIDGVSLTVAYVDNRIFKVSVIPHTGEETILLKKRPGDTVNLENDLIGKYVEKLMAFRKAEKEQAGSLDMDFLRKNGFC